MKKKEIIDLFSKVFGKQSKIYLKSVKKKEEQFFFMVRDKQRKYLAVAALPEKIKKLNFYAEQEKKTDNKENILFQICPLERHNLEKLQMIFPYLKPSSTGIRSSFGTGDRLGIATPAHIQAFKGKNIFPVLAQQSVREMDRTESDWQKVMDNVLWGCFEEGYEGPFGADADHVKDLDNLQKAIDCGFTFFTIDPSDHINENFARLSVTEAKNKYQAFPEREKIEKNYLDQEYKICKEALFFDQNSLAEIVLTYGQAMGYIERCYQYIKKHHKNKFELEISIDETSNPTSILAHLWIVLELRRRGIDFQSLAPHYIGDWEKGIDYIGDLNTFQEEFKLHYQIASKAGGYKLSLHSGSDKFSVYPIFAKESQGLFHVKTAGTSWLEAMKVIAMCQPDLYREIHQFALHCFEKDRFSYHLSTDLSKIPDITRLKDQELVKLFIDNHSRQLIHITYGSILREKDAMGQYKFKDQIYKVLYQNEETHYKEVAQHIRYHLELLNL